MGFLQLLHVHLLVQGTPSFTQPQRLLSHPVVHTHCFISIRSGGAGSCFIGIGSSTPSFSLHPYCSGSFCRTSMSCVVRNALSLWRSEASGVGVISEMTSVSCLAVTLDLEQTKSLTAQIWITLVHDSHQRGNATCFVDLTVRQIAVLEYSQLCSEVSPKHGQCFIQRVSKEPRRRITAAETVQHTKSSCVSAPGD